MMGGAVIRLNASLPWLASVGAMLFVAAIVFGVL